MRVVHHFKFMATQWTAHDVNDRILARGYIDNGTIGIYSYDSRCVRESEIRTDMREQLNWLKDAANNHY